MTDDREVLRFSGVDGVDLVADVVGRGETCVLVHGFAASAAVNWERPGVVAGLVAKGRRVVALDLRGHGRSGCPHSPAAYREEVVRGDLLALLDRLQVGDVDLVGYSLGSRVVASVGAVEPRVRALVLGGVGQSSLGVAQGTEELALAMEAPRAADVSGRRARAFRHFADATRADRQALAAWQRALALWPPFDPRSLTQPVLVVAGDADELAGSPEPLAAELPRGRAARVPGHHMNAMLHPAFVEMIGRFLDDVARSRREGSAPSERLRPGENGAGDGLPEATTRGPAGGTRPGGQHRR